MYPWYVAVMVTKVVEETEPVTKLTLGDVLAPAATVTLGGTGAAEGLLLDNDTRAPPAGATPFKLTLT